MARLLRAIRFLGSKKVIALAILVLIIGGTINFGSWGEGDAPRMSGELSNGPKRSSAIDDDHGISHESWVYYTKETDPFVAEVDRVHFGGRKKDTSLPESVPEWRRHDTEYKEWNGTKWVREKKIGPGRWKSSGPEELDWWNLENDVTLEGGALVKQRLHYRYFLFGEIDFEWSGPWHRHYLE